MTETIEKFARRLLEAAQSDDLTTLNDFYTDDAILWFNVSGERRSIQEHIRMATAARKNRRSVHYIDVRITPVEGGFVQQWTVRIVDVQGKRQDMPACMVCRMRDGRIYLREEYYDSAQRPN